jgi:CheY-like chemotaxis protein
MKPVPFYAHVRDWKIDRSRTQVASKRKVHPSAMPKILVVDDEPLIALMIADWLEEQGFEILGPAHSVPQALELLATDTAHAAILDVSLGDSDCYDVADALAAKSIPFAFATGYGADSVASRFSNVITVTKPFDFEAVRDVVGRLLAKSPSA